MPNPDSLKRPRTQLYRALEQIDAAIAIADTGRMDRADAAFYNGLGMLAEVVRSMYPDPELKASGRAIRAAWRTHNIPSAAAGLNRLNRCMNALEAPIVNGTLAGALIDIRAGVQAHRYKLHDFSSECFKRGVGVLGQVVRYQHPNDKELKACGRLIRDNYLMMKAEPIAALVVDAVNRLERRASELMD